LFSKSAVLLCLLFLFLTFPVQESHAQVTGRVTDAKQEPIPQVNIFIKDTGLGTQTDAQGEYAIQANPGDILIFSHVGMEAAEIRVKKSSSVYNVSLIAAHIDIEEVEIRAKANTAYKSQKELLKEFPENKKLVKTAWGILDQDLSSSFFRIVDGEDLVNAGTDFFYSFEAHIPQLRVIRNDPDNPGVHVYLRGIEPLFDVDGFVNPAPPTYLSANDIDRIAVLERNAAIARYGPQGAAGVIVVNTRAQTSMDNTGVDRSEDHRLFLDSLIGVTHLEPYSPYVPPYLEKLPYVRSKKKVLAIVADEQNSHLNDPYYFLDIYDYFLSRWGKSEKTKEFSQHITENFSEDLAVLKALAYLQQEHAYYLDALSTYIIILKSQSWYAQPLRDVANAYAEVGDYEKAWMYYTQYIEIMDQLPNAAYDAYGEDLLITTEMLNILGQNKEVLFDSMEILTGMEDDDPQTRLVFEWNNPDAEFDLQFVTPEGYFDTWSNKAGTDPVQDPEAENGYSSQQFLLGKENVGRWQVNVDFKGNHSEMPTYLKLAVYRDYGLPSQEVEIQVYKLSENHKKVQLFTLLQK